LKTFKNAVLNETSMLVGVGKFIKLQLEVNEIYAELLTFEIMTSANLLISN